MAKARITEVMMDDTSINVSKEVDLVFSIANSLRGAYKSDKYKDVIIPMIIIRRFECALAKTKAAVVEAFEAKRDIPPQILESKSGYKFYNTSRYTLAELLNDADNIVSNFKSYIEGFSANVQSIIRNLDFEKQIDFMDKNNRLLGVVRKFSELDLNPNTIDGIKAGYMFEEIIRKFSENAEAGDHYTPREVIRLLVSIILAEGCDDLYTERRVATVLDMACGSGGMLSTTHDVITRMNPDAEVRLFGQEINPESYAICLADMLIKGENAENIRLQDTMKADCFEGQDMRIVIANPPFGAAWGGKDAADGVESAVKKEHKKVENVEGLEKLGHSRFPWGLPSSSDMQLLFMQHAISKLSKDGRAAIISNGSPLFSGNTTSGESQIRRFMLEHDLVEAIIALPTDLFYNTSIGIYAFILSRNKRPERRGKIQLINAVDMYKPLPPRKSLGKKRKELSRDDIRTITEIYSNFAEGVFCKIFNKEDFMYMEYAVYQPLQRHCFLTADAVASLKTSAYFTADGNVFNRTEFEELLETDPREGDDERKFQKFVRGKAFTEAVIAILEEHADGTEYDDFAKFIVRLKELIGGVDGMTDSRLNKIAMEMSVIDKTAVVQKDKNGKVITDSTTKDTEIIGLRLDVEEYFKREVYPHIPDALYTYEYDPNKKITSSNRERLGAQFPFTRYFEEYEPTETAESLLAQYSEYSASLTGSGAAQNIETAIQILERQVDVLRRYKKALITETVTRGMNTSVKTKESGIAWIGAIPEHWTLKKIKYLATLKGRIGWQGLTSDEYTDEGAYLITGTDFVNGCINWETCVRVPMKRWEEAKDIQILDGDLLITKDGTVGKVAIVSDLEGPCSLNSGVLRISTHDDGYDRRFLYWVLQSDVFWKWFTDRNAGNSTIIHLYQNDFAEFAYPIPPLDEQIAIADFLDAKCAKTMAV